MRPSIATARIQSRISWLRPWMVVALLTTGYCLYTLAANAWDPMTFVVIGEKFDPAHGVAELGYDGQFAYQIAIDPGGAAPYLDNPPYRYQRILYPILARALALGSPAAIPWTLILINLVSIVLGTLAAELLLARRGFSRWYALAYGLFAGLLMSLRLDLTEPLAFALAQWGVLLFDRGRLWRSLPFFALAALTRELTLMFAAACAVSLLTAGRKRDGLIWGVSAALPFALWQLALALWLGSWGISSGGALATGFELIPFRGWWGFQAKDQPLFILLTVVIWLTALLPALAAIIVSLRALWNRQMGLGVWILLINALIFPFLPASNVLNLPGLLRTTVGLVAAVLDFGAIQSSRRALFYAQLWLFLLAFGEGLIAIQ